MEKKNLIKSKRLDISNVLCNLTNLDELPRKLQIVVVVQDKK